MDKTINKLQYQSLKPFLLQIINCIEIEYTAYCTICSIDWEELNTASHWSENK